MAAQTKRLSPAVIAADRSLLLALQSLSDYQPINSSYSVATMQQYEATLCQAEQAVIHAQEALEQARKVEIETAYALHDIALGAKNQVIAQYGSDALAIEIIGLTRKSNRKRPMKRKVAA
ncbi:MAG: hypothetical protein HGA19_18130 [Oscillochloris sp.]|nr:hypothetical protein [Oscillochloris sp.]